MNNFEATPYMNIEVVDFLKWDYVITPNSFWLDDLYLEGLNFDYSEYFSEKFLNWPHSVLNKDFNENNENTIDARYIKLNSDLVSFVRAIEILDHIRRCYCDEQTLTDLNHRRISKRNFQELSLKEIESIAISTQYIANETGDRLYKWLDTNTNFRVAFNNMKKKKWKWYIPETVNGGPRFPLKYEVDAKFMSIVIKTIFVVSGIDNCRRIKKPTERAKKLANNLRMELENKGGLSKTYDRCLRQIINDSGKVLATSMVTKKENEIVKEITESLGKEMKRNFKLLSAKKGRPFVDVIVELLSIFGHELDMRQGHRYLKKFDTQESLHNTT